MSYTVTLPDGRVVPLPTCPVCGATGNRCKRPSGHEASRWHELRETELAEICRCDEVCLPWLNREMPHPSQLHLEVGSDAE